MGRVEHGESVALAAVEVHGSNGVLGDVGIHILDFATFIAGSQVADMSCRLKTVDKAPDGRTRDYVLDANDSIAMHVGMRCDAMRSV
jgi:predicted dehydrogenase